MRKGPFFCLLLCGTMLLSGCAHGAKPAQQDTDEMQAAPPQAAAFGKIDMSAWHYSAETDVYWQTGIVYCAAPADASYENLGIYVPGAYLTGTDNGDGTYTCRINASGSINGLTAETAPIVIPVDTPGYAAMAAPTDYESSTSPYTDAGLIYVHAGCRGREAGAPAGVTDLKAAIRYLRYNEALLPGSTARIFSFGMSGGGAQSALLGATGDSALYTPYLEAIGAVEGVSDAVAGAMCWCPITSLDYASEAYEWNMGVTRSGLSAEMQALSDAMAQQFALHLNELGLTDADGNTLTLEQSETGIYQAGSYYAYLKAVVETSLNHFLEDTAFPYSAADSGPSGFGGRGGGLDGKGGFGEKGDLDGEGGFDGKGGFGEKGDLDGEGGFGEKGDLDGKGGFEDRDGLPELDGELPPLDGENQNYYDLDGINRAETGGGLRLSGVYETRQDYIDALNAETTWVLYDSETNTATITSLADFVCALKNASKNLGAFDALDETQGENILFGDGDGSGDHFDAAMAALLAGTEYEAAFAEDLARTDALGVTVEDRVHMYTPLYYLCSSYDGYGSANVAAYWRIRSGINQSDTALTTEVNLALALESYGVQVDFETVWGQAHVEAERTGDSTSNLIAWILECCQ